MKVDDILILEVNSNNEPYYFDHRNGRYTKDYKNYLNLSDMDSSNSYIVRVQRVYDHHIFNINELIMFNGIKYRIVEFKLHDGKLWAGTEDRATGIKKEIDIHKL